MHNQCEHSPDKKNNRVFRGDPVKRGRDVPVAHIGIVPNETPLLSLPPDNTGTSLSRKEILKAGLSLQLQDPGLEDVST